MVVIVVVANQLGKALDEGNDFLPTYHYYQSPSLEKRSRPKYILYGLPFTGVWDSCAGKHQQ